MMDLLNAEAAEGTKCAPNAVLIPLEEVFGLVRAGAHSKGGAKPLNKSWIDSVKEGYSAM